MTLLNKVKDDVARKHGYENFNQFLFDNWLHDVEMNQIIDEAMQEYAKMLCDKQLNIAAKHMDDGYLLLTSPFPNELKE